MTYFRLLLVFIGAFVIGLAINKSYAYGRPDLHQMVREKEIKYGIPAGLLHAVIMVESKYNCQAYNRRSGVKGIGQVKPQTARSVGVHGNLFHCRTGATAAARYLRLAIHRGGAGCAGVSLYERGVYARPVCTSYGRKVMAYRR